MPNSRLIRHGKRFIFGLIGLGIAVLAHGNAHAIVLTFTNQADWEATLSGATFLTETFDGPAANFPANSTGNPAGPVTIDVDGDPGANPVGITGSGFFQGYLEDDDPVDLGFNRPNMIGVAFLGLSVHPNESRLDLQEIGFDFGSNDVPGFEFLACEVFALCVPDSSGFIDDAVEEDGTVDFIGFVFDGLRDRFELDHGNGIRDLAVDGTSEAFLLDTLIIAEAAAIPEPGALALFGLGLLGLGGMQLRKARGLRSIST